MLGEEMDCGCDGPLGCMGDCNREKWVPPRCDAILRRPTKVCWFCLSPDYHCRTRRCARCGRREAPKDSERQKAADRRPKYRQPESYYSAHDPFS